MKSRRRVPQLYYTYTRYNINTRFVNGPYARRIGPNPKTGARGFGRSRNEPEGIILQGDVPTGRYRRSYSVR